MTRRSVCLWVLVLLLVSSSTAAVGAVGTEPGGSERARPALGVVPDGTVGVFVGPDGRVWREVERLGTRVGADEARRRIAEQFDAEAPVLEGARPVLFEPGGRVWFSLGTRGEALAGYDGRQWVDSPPAAGERLRFVGHAPNHAVLHPSFGANRYHAGRAFLVSRRGVHTYDGAAWSDRDMFGRDGLLNTHVHVARVVGGDDLVALAFDHAEDFQRVWRWRAFTNGWEEVALPPRIANAPRFHEGLAAVDEALYIVDGPGLYRVPLDRELASDAEWADLRVSRFGRYEFERAFAAVEAPGGGVLLLASGVRGGGVELGHAVIVREPGGRERALPLAFHPAVQARDKAAFVDDRRVWLSGAALDRGGLIDLDTGQVLGTLPFPGCDVEVALPDGRVVLSRYVDAHLRPASGRGGVPFAVYDPRGRQTQPTVTPIGSVRVNSVPRIAPDGGIVVGFAEGGVHRFDAAGWRALTPPQEGGFTVSAAGHADAFLAHASDGRRPRKVFYDGATLHRAASVAELIERHEYAFAQAFAGLHLPGDVSVSRAGHIWMSERHDERPTDVRLRYAGRWFDATAALREAFPEGEWPSGLVMIGGGDAVLLVGEERPWREGETAVLRFDGEAVRVTGLSDAGAFAHGGAWGVPEGGGVWLAAEAHDRPRQRAALFHADGRPQMVAGLGWPLFRDAGGAVVFGSRRGETPGSVTFARGGVAEATLVVPGWSSRSAVLGTRDGRLFAWTALGPREIVREGGVPRLGTQWVVSGLPGSDAYSTSVIGSPLGYFAVLSTAQNGGYYESKPWLSIVPAPRAVER